MSHNVVRSRPMRPVERLRYRLHRWLDRHRANAAVLLAFGIVFTVSVLLAGLIL